MITEIERNTLVRKAMDARENAYARYSGYQVGAALLTLSGDIFTGVNVENAAYPVTMCAERTAVFKAVSEGEREFKAVAVATDNGGSPCGSCRQVLAEFGLETLVMLVDSNGNVVEEKPLAEYLPNAFTPDKLE